MKLLLTIFKGKGDFPTITCGICDLVEEMSVEWIWIQIIQFRWNSIKPEIYMMQNIDWDAVIGIVMWSWRNGEGQGLTL